MKAELKAIFVSRYQNGGFRFPRVIHSDEYGIDFAPLLEIFKELRGEGHDFHLHEEAPSADELSASKLHSGTELARVKANRDSPVLTALVSQIRIQAKRTAALWV